MPLPRLTGTLFLALGLVTACSSSSDDADDAETVPEATTQAFATARCDLLERCTPFVLSSSFADKASCTSTFQASLKEELGLRGVRVTASAMAACSAKLGTVACNDPVTPAECTFAGTLANDQPCGSSLQCSSGQCFLASGTASATSYCGTCKAFVPEGGDCANASCESGLSCSTANVCVRGAAAGATCSDAFDCGGDLQCVGGKCTAPLQQGARCTPGGASGGSCDLGKGLFCVQIGPAAISTQCTPANYAAVGQPCNIDSSAGAIVLCAAGVCAGAETGKGTCAARLAEGAACATELEATSCGLGLTCTNAVCAKPLLATCNP